MKMKQRRGKIILDEQWLFNEATNFYHKNTYRTLGYLYKRKIFKPIIEKMKIGYAKNDNMLYRTFCDKYNIDNKLYNIENGRDYFKNRIIFPIISRGNTIYFTSRSVNNDTESKHLHLKGNVKKLYNHDILETDCKYIIITEGIIDCLTLLQHGYKAVATYGTSAFKRDYCYDIGDRRIYIAFDNDENKSGFKGALKIAEKLHYATRNYPFIVNIPKEQEKKMDVNEFYVKNGIDKLREIIFKKAVNVTKYDEFWDLVNAEKKHYKNKSNGDIIRIIGQYLNLKKSGQYYKAKCPFHNEDNASFTIYEKTNSWFCFGCGEYGDVEKFIKKIG